MQVSQGTFWLVTAFSDTVNASVAVAPASLLMLQLRTAKSGGYSVFTLFGSKSPENFADPKNPSHNGMQTDRGRIYVIYGPPDRIDQHPSSFYEFWNYRATGQPPLPFQFSLPPIDSCDGSYRITSRPMATFESDGHLVVQVYPGHFITTFIPLVFSKTAGLSWSLRTISGEPVLENDDPVLDGAYGPVPIGDSLAQHLFGCRFFGTDGMAFTHPLCPGSYAFSSTVTLTNGEVQRDTVRFDLP